MEQIGPSSRIRMAADVVTRQFDGETVMLDLARGSYFALNPMGARMLEKLAVGSSPQEIADELQPEYAVTARVLLEDVIRLTSDLLSRGLIQIR